MLQVARFSLSHSQQLKEKLRIDTPFVVVATVVDDVDTGVVVAATVVEEVIAVVVAVATNVDDAIDDVG